MLASLYSRIKPFRGKSRVLPILVKISPGRATRSYYGVRMINNARDSTWRQCISGAYGDLLEKHLESIERPFVFLDIGSNQGLFSILAAKNDHCRRVIAFEPNSETFSLLVRNVALAEKSEIIHTICGAIVDGKTRPVSLHVPAFHSGAASLTQDHANRNAREIVTIGLGSDFVRDIAMAPEHFELHAKVDVEGAELVVIDALESATVLSKIKSLTVEMSDMTGGDGRSEAIAEKLRMNGFSISQRSGSAKHFDAIFIRR